MRLPFRHQHDVPAEASCPRCKVPVPNDDLECNVCGWDLRDAYHAPEGGAAVDPHVTAPRDRGEPPLRLNGGRRPRVEKGGHGLTRLDRDRHRRR